MAKTNSEISQALISSTSGDGGGARVFAVSDIHADHPENMQWVFSLPCNRYRNDALIVAGDVSDDLETLARALGGLRERFGRVLFVPGNHELWVHRGECEDSWEKFCLIQALCDRLDIGMLPERV